MLLLRTINIEVVEFILIFDFLPLNKQEQFTCCNCSNEFYYIDLDQVQAIEMYGAAQPDFLKSKTNGGIKNIISHHLKIIKRCVFSPNLEGVAKK